MCPNQGLNLQLRYVPWPGVEPKTFWCMGQCSNQLSHPARAILRDSLQGKPSESSSDKMRINWKNTGESQIIQYQKFLVGHMGTGKLSGRFFSLMWLLILADLWICSIFLSPDWNLRQLSRSLLFYDFRLYKTSSTMLGFLGSNSPEKNQTGSGYCIDYV